MEGTIAEIRMFAGNFSPRNWAYCNGQLLAIATNTALFSLLGTIYGGNGSTTFALPDFRGRSPVSAGQGPGLSYYSLGEASGSQEGYLSLINLPNHTHTATGTPSITVNQPCNTGEATLNEPDGMYPATPSGGAGMYGTPSDDVMKTYDLAPHSNIVAGNTGGSQPFELGSPYLGINYIICMYGIFPSRN